MPEQKNNYTIGIDIGGTKMSAVLFDVEKKEVIADYKLATPKESLDKFLVMLWALVDPLIEKAKKSKIKISHIGAGIPGVIAAPTDKNEKGLVLHCPNLKILDNVELGEKIKAKYDLPVLLDNDANCFLRAEMILGAAKNSASVFGVTLGTGIGGAISLDNKVYQGIHGSAGEISCLIADIVEGTPMTLEEVFHNLTQGNPYNMAEEAYNGDKLAIKAYTEIGQHLGLALAGVVNLFDPEIIVIGGSVMASSDLFLNEIKKNLKDKVLSPKLKKIKIVPAKMQYGGAVGAALLT
ncbi:MAG: ROK family protein [Patescibacteria group bacterium]|jgi:glucokinase